MTGELQAVAATERRLADGCRRAAWRGWNARASQEDLGHSRKRRTPVTHSRTDSTAAPTSTQLARKDSS